MSLYNFEQNVIEQCINAVVPPFNPAEEFVMNHICQTTSSRESRGAGVRYSYSGLLEFLYVAEAVFLGYTSKEQLYVTRGYEHTMQLALYEKLLEKVSQEHTGDITLQMEAFLQPRLNRFHCCRQRHRPIFHFFPTICGKYCNEYSVVPLPTQYAKCIACGGTPHFRIFPRPDSLRWARGWHTTQDFREMAATACNLCETCYDLRFMQSARGQWLLELKISEQQAT